MVKDGAAVTKDEASLHVLTCKGLQHILPSEKLTLLMKSTGQTHTDSTPFHLWTAFYIYVCKHREKGLEG